MTEYSFKPSDILTAQSATEDTQYKRPKITAQDKLTYDEIKEKLINYEKVKDLSSLPLYTHLRYIEIKINPKTKKKEQKFRLGGFLINKDHYDKYIVLSNGKLKWSVQTPSAVFYASTVKRGRKKGSDEGIESETISKQQADKILKDIKTMKELIVNQELEIQKLKKKNHKLKREIEDK